MIGAPTDLTMGMLVDWRGLEGWRPALMETCCRVLVPPADGPGSFRIALCLAEIPCMSTGCGTEIYNKPKPMTYFRNTCLGAIRML